MSNPVTDPRVHDLLHRYHHQLRDLTGSANGPSEQVRRVGPIVQRTPTRGQGSITYRDLGGMDGEELDTFVASQVAHFARAGVAVEWEHHHYDAPADLPWRLRAAGFAPREPETVMVTEAIDVAIASRLPTGVMIREVGSDEDLERLRAFQEPVWGGDLDWLPETLRDELLNSSTPPLVLLAEAGPEVVAGCWLRFHPGSEFASLGGRRDAATAAGRGHLSGAAGLPGSASAAARLSVPASQVRPGRCRDSASAGSHGGGRDDALRLGTVKIQELDATGGERPALSVMKQGRAGIVDPPNGRDRVPFRTDAFLVAQRLWCFNRRQLATLR